ncbi:MAG TPA: hypothetical protein VEZ88_02725 [Steroidobacteraceae bacterium]|nr:hypothetical protein [Steroidobacteraceae bacterium]
MRLALTVFLVALQLSSMVQAADETTTAPAAAASTAATAAESSAPVPATEATPATPEIPAAQPQASEAAQHADTANAPAAKATAATAAAAPAMTQEQEQAAFDERMKRQGYKLTTLSGQTVYCKGGQQQMGTRLGRKTMCWTGDQIRSHEDSVQTVREKQGQKETMGGT